MVPSVTAGNSSQRGAERTGGSENWAGNTATVQVDHPTDTVTIGGDVSIPPIIGRKHSSQPIEEPGGCPNDAGGMPGHRHRKQGGQLVAKRGDTRTATVRTKDHLYLPWIIPPETHLQVLRQICGAMGLHKVSAILRQFELCGQLRDQLLRHGITPVKMDPI